MTSISPRRAATAAAWLAALVTLPLPDVARAVEPEVVQLEYRFRAGDRIDMQVAHRALTETTMEGLTQTVETMTDSTKTWTVLQVDSDGHATIEHSVNDVTMTSRASDRGELRWSSAGDDEPPPGYESVRGSLGVPLSRFVVDRTGRIVTRHDLHPCPPSSTGDLVVVPLPEGPIEPGAEWTVPQEVVVEVPGGPRKAVRTRLRYRLARIADGRAIIRVDTTVLTPVDDPRLEARLLERIWDGEIVFDIETGLVERRRTTVDRRVVGFGGPQSSVRYKASLEERLATP
jgi:hypothetical protein